MGFDTLMRNITRTGGVAPARAYVGELLPDVPAGIQPGRVSTVRPLWTLCRTGTARWPTARVLIVP